LLFHRLAPQAVAKGPTPYSNVINDGGSPPKKSVKGISSFRLAPNNVEHIPEKLLDFFDSDMLQIFEVERFLFDQVIPRDREAR
jgi:hypothetical protein